MRRTGWQTALRGAGSVWRANAAGSAAPYEQRLRGVAGTVRGLSQVPRTHPMGLRDRFSQWLAAWRPHRSLGQRGETLAARFLKKKGYRILARSDRQRSGEIDLIALDGRTLVFVEVKTRRSHEKGLPADAVDEAKQRRLTRLALMYLKKNGLLEHPARFDVVAITWGESQQAADIQHYRHAFEATGSGSCFS